MVDYIQTLKITYKEDLLGTLTYTGTEYIFEYSAKFKELKLQPLPGIDHPKSASKTLWSYFQSRIPNVGSPLYMRLFEKYNLSKEDEKSFMKLLSTVGSRVATDPFIIEV